mgnify:FL=1|tara:strand:+ start:8675 stop:10369 length:1695 start_codon:yes stop_codon:yes gene_type:complete
MVAPVLGLPALLQAIATIGVGGAIGYKAQKDLQPVIKQLKASPEDMDSSELRMLRALLMPNQAIASELKDMTTSKSVGTTGEGTVIGPRAEDIEQVQEEIKEVSKPPVTKTPVEPITTETFPDEPQIKQDPPVQPEIDLDTKETFPADTAIDPAPVFYSKAQEGGKEITAGVSAQKEDIPELLEQGKLAVPIKKFFEDTPDVINYKIADTVGSYAETVERSLDIEANVKSNFDLNKFGDVIKERAKEFDQDAAFVAETVPSFTEGANIGFEMDFGSNLKMQDALNFANLVNETATVDGFTFKVKNLDSSGSSIYLPQTQKDLELIQQSIKKYGTTEDIREAGFIMPDGKMLNFNMRGGNFRDTEHRRVGFLTTEGYNGVDFGPMYDWMLKTGGVRVTGNQNRLYAEFAGKPTTTQIKKLTDEYNQNRDRYDSMIVSITMPGDEDFFRGGFGSEKYRGGEKGLDLRKQKLRLPNEAFYEVNGEEANANDINRKFKATDIVGKTFTGLRQINIPEFSNLSNEDARKRINSIYQNIEGLSENSGLKKLDKPKIKFYNTKLYTKGRDY